MSEGTTSRPAGELLAEVSRQVDELLASSTELTPDIERQALALLAEAVRLYGEASRLSGGEMLSMKVPVNATDATTVASVLILSQGLSLFEFNIWFSRMAHLEEIHRGGTA